MKMFHFQSRQAPGEERRPAATRVCAFDGSASGSRCGWILALLGIALGLTPRLALGQTTWQFDKCLNDCFRLCDLGPARLAFGCRENCGGQCAKYNQNVPAPYGAIAVGAGGQGISQNRASWAAADRDAIAACNKYGSDCKVVYRFQNTCAAIAEAKGTQHFEVATGSTEKEAAASATAVCQQHWGACRSALSTCSLTGTGGSNQPKPPAQPHAISWGAIAYSAADMGAGWSQGKSDRASAEKEAMDACSQRGKACALRTAFNKQCGALAADRSFVGWATSTEPRDAQQKAVEECAKNGGARCALHVFFCSF
ncbi:MAG: DUF4189 domain-containing protein [Bryobacteraceae bacterium]